MLKELWQSERSARQLQGFVVANERVSDAIYLLDVFIPKRFIEVRAGQFLMLKAGLASDPLLNRPFSIHNVSFEKDGMHVWVLYLVKRVGTTLLTQKRPSDKIDLIIPLGNSFFSYLDLDALKDLILVAGGIGVAPYYLFMNKVRKCCPNVKPKLFYGAKDAPSLYKRWIDESMFSEIIYATDNGSYGFKGNIIAALYHYLGQHQAVYNKNKLTIISCGSINMLYKLNMMLDKTKIDHIVSLEGPMGCGMGLCLGCVIESRDGSYVKLCQHGPIFKSNEILWEKLPFLNLS